VGSSIWRTGEEEGAIVVVGEGGGSFEEAPLEEVGEDRINRYRDG
jgi:hypothetical protein